MEAGRRWCVVWILLLAVSLPGAEGLRLETEDGLALEFSPEGLIDGVTIDGGPLPLRGPGGIYVKDMSPEAEPQRMNVHSRAYEGTAARGRAERTGPREVRCRGSLQAEGLVVETRYRAEPGYLRIDTEVTNTRAGEDRALILYFRLPLDLTGARWWRNLHRSDPIDPSTRYLNPYYTYQGYRPCASESVFTAVTGIDVGGREAGLSLVVPMDVPRYFRTTYEGRFGYQVEVELGLSPLTRKFPNRAGFSVLLYRVDPRWGLRSTVERYYRFFPRLFTRRAARGGNWYIGDDLERELPRPEEFALRFKETYLWINSETVRHGILAMKYVEPWCDHYYGTEELMRLQARDLPINNIWAPTGKSQPIRVQAQALIISGVRRADGSLYGPNHKHFHEGHTTFSRFYGKHWPQAKRVLGLKDGPLRGYRYPTNPDIELPGMCRGKSVMQYEVYNQWGRKPRSPHDVYDGIYFDSTAGWWTGWHLNNFNREHFPYADHPLVFDHRTGRAALLHGLSCLEFLRYLSERVHREGRLTMANSGPGLFINFAAPYLDMMGTGENYRPGDHKGLWLMRTVAYHKPLSYLKNPRPTEEDLEHCLAFAVFPGGPRSKEEWERLRPLYRRYMPVLERLDQAGWEPVPAAEVEPEALTVERFGPEKSGAVLLVVHNLTDKTVEGTLRLVGEEMARRVPGWTGAARAVEVLSGRPLRFTAEGGDLRLPVRLAGERSWVVEVRPVPPDVHKKPPAKVELEAP